MDTKEIKAQHDIIERKIVKALSTWTAKHELADLREQELKLQKICPHAGEDFHMENGHCSLCGLLLFPQEEE